MDPTVPWIEALRELLCKLYKAWGGDCDDLGTSPTQWIDTLENEYDAKGAPTFSNEQERQEFLDTLDQTENHLDNSGNSLSPADDARLRTLISNLKSDVST